MPKKNKSKKPAAKNNIKNVVDADNNNNNNNTSPSVDHHDNRTTSHNTSSCQPVEVFPSKDLGVKIKPGMTKSQITQKKRNVLNHKMLIEERRRLREEERHQDDHQEAEDYSDTANERAAEYKQGGYHPVVKGDIYNERYRVVRKLGWGYFSTVWLVWDYQHEKFQAMKIQKSDKQYRDAAFDEIRLLRDIMHSDTRGERCCARMSDSFEHIGPNGVHICMVFDILGENLLCLIERYEHRGIPIPIVKSLTREMLIGLHHVHTINIIHTDLKPENVLLSQPKHAILHEMKKYVPPPVSQHIKLEERDVSTMTKSQRKRYYQKINAKKNNNNNANNKEEGKHCDPMEGLNKDEEKEKNNNNNNNEEDATKAKPTEAEDSASETDDAWEVERFHHCCVADFGNSCYVDQPITDEVQTRQYRAPEVIVGNGYGPPIDIWSLACMVFELLTGEFLFDPKQDENGNYSRDEDHLALMTELLGSMPDCITKGHGRFRDRFYNSKGRLRNIHDLRPSTLFNVLHRRYQFSEKKSHEIAAFLLPMLEGDPRHRATAAEMLTEFADWFEVLEDDYEPLCKRDDTNQNGGDNNSGSSDEGGDERSSDEEDGDDEEITVDDDYDERGGRRGDNGGDEDAVSWYQSHPLLNPAVLASQGLTLQDITTVMSGGVLPNAAQHRAVLQLMEELVDDDDYDDN